VSAGRVGHRPYRAAGYAAENVRRFLPGVPWSEGAAFDMEAAVRRQRTQLFGPMLSRLCGCRPQRACAQAWCSPISGGVPGRFLVGLAVLCCFEVAADRPLLFCLMMRSGLTRHRRQVAGVRLAAGWTPNRSALFGTRDPPGCDLAPLPRLALADFRRRMPGAAASFLARRWMSGAGTGSSPVRANPLPCFDCPAWWTAAGSWPAVWAAARPSCPAVSSHLRASAGARFQSMTRPGFAPARGGPSPRRPGAGPVAGGRNFGISALTRPPPRRADGCSHRRSRWSIFLHPLSLGGRPAAVVRRPPRAHCALSEATDPGTDPAAGLAPLPGRSPGPTRTIAAGWNRSARAVAVARRVRGSAAFLDRAYRALGLESPRRAERSLAAAQARFQACALDAAWTACTAEVGPLDDSARPADLLRRGQIAFCSPSCGDAPAGRSSCGGSPGF